MAGCCWSRWPRCWASGSAGPGELDLPDGAAEPAAMPDFAPLPTAALPRAAALSALIGWNQNVEDWRIFAEQGAVRMLEDGDPRALAATAAVLPYGERVAWISMVLVRPDRRREGLATALMRWAVEHLQATGIPCIALDATPAGRPVYAKL